MCLHVEPSAVGKWIVCKGERWNKIRQNASPASAICIRTYLSKDVLSTVLQDNNKKKKV